LHRPPRREQDHVIRRARDLAIVRKDERVEPDRHLLRGNRFGALQLACGINRPRLGDDGKPDLDEDRRPMLVAKYGLHAMRHACAALLIDQG
jgi:hypothetical protein